MLILKSLSPNSYPRIVYCPSSLEAIWETDFATRTQSTMRFTQRLYSFSKVLFLYNMCVTSPVFMIGVSVVGSDNRKPSLLESILPSVLMNMTQKADVPLPPPAHDGYERHRLINPDTCTRKHTHRHMDTLSHRNADTLSHYHISALAHPHRDVSTTHTCTHTLSQTYRYSHLKKALANCLSDARCCTVHAGIYARI